MLHYCNFQNLEDPPIRKQTITVATQTEDFQHRKISRADGISHILHRVSFSDETKDIMELTDNNKSSDSDLEVLQTLCKGGDHLKDDILEKRKCYVNSLTPR